MNLHATNDNLVRIFFPRCDNLFLPPSTSSFCPFFFFFFFFFLFFLLLLYCARSAHVLRYRGIAFDTPLHVAAARNYKKMVKMLLGASEIDAKDKAG